MRCKACDSIMDANEILWDEEQKQHEELCRRCRDAVRTDDDIDIVYDAELISINDTSGGSSE
jgi:hypothetical protein